MALPGSDPLVQSIEVGCSQAQAFELWAFKPSTWWPMVDHSTFGDEAIAVTIEPAVGGRIYETGRHGRQRDWGRVTSWNPPSGISFTWHIYGEPEDATDVEVTFTQISPERTSVTIAHSGWERLGDRADLLYRNNEAGWRDLLAAFATAINRDPDRG